MTSTALTTSTTKMTKRMEYFNPNHSKSSDIFCIFSAVFLNGIMEIESAMRTFPKTAGTHIAIYIIFSQVFGHIRIFLIVVKGLFLVT